MINCLLTILLAFACAVPTAAQNDPAKPASKPAPNKAVGTATAKPGAQDPRATEETGVTKTPAERAAELRKELEKIESELANVRQVQQKGGFTSLVKRRINGPKPEIQSFRPVDTGPAPAPGAVDRPTNGAPGADGVAPQPRPSIEVVRKPVSSDADAAVATEGDTDAPPVGPKGGHDADNSKILFTVDGTAVTEREFAPVLAFFTRHLGDEKAAKRRAIYNAALRAAARTVDPIQTNKNRALMAQIAAQIGVKIPFESAVEKYSTCPSREKKGELGFLGAMTRDPYFMMSVLSLEPGDKIGGIESIHGFHYVECQDMKTEGGRSMVDIRHLQIDYSDSVAKAHERVRGGEAVFKFVDKSLAPFAPRTREDK